MGKAKSIALSDSRFYESIVNKYQKGKFNPLRFPMMIFFKNKGYIRSHNFAFLLQLHFLIDKRFLDFSSNEKMVHAIERRIVEPKNANITRLFRHMALSVLEKDVLRIKRLLPELKNETIIHLLVEKHFSINSAQTANRAFPKIQLTKTSRLLPALFIPENRMTIVSFIESVLYRVGSGIVDLYEIRRSPFMRSRTLLHTPARSNALSSGETSGRSPKTVGNFLLIEKIAASIDSNFTPASIGSDTFSQTNNISVRHYLPEEKLSPVLPKVTSLLINKYVFNVNRRSGFASSNDRITPYKSLMGDYHPNPGKAISVPIKTPSFRTGTEDFFFNNQRRLEEEVEGIKKVIDKTQEFITVNNNSAPSFDEKTIKQALDINRISDQVYRDIEQRIRIERERRGL